MYICLCNAISDKQVRARACQGPCSVSDVYRACGCAAQCGKCAAAIRSVLSEFHDRGQSDGAFLEGATAAPSE